MTATKKIKIVNIIAENGNAFSNSLIIYIGPNQDKIKQGYAVVNSKGLIGRIELVSGNYAKVSLITDINSKIPVVSAKSRDRGILLGQNKKELSLIFSLGYFFSIISVLGTLRWIHLLYYSSV